MTQSPHQLLYNLYNIIALTEIKGYAMLQFAYMMLKIYDKVKEFISMPMLSMNTFHSGQLYS